MKNYFNYKNSTIIAFYLGWALVLFRNEIAFYLAGHDVLLLSDYSLYGESGRLAFNAWWETESYRSRLKLVGLTLISISFFNLIVLKIKNVNNVGLVLFVFILSSLLFYIWPGIKIIFT